MSKISCPGGCDRWLDDYDFVCKKPRIKAVV
jgi:hypothetical protein